MTRCRTRASSCRAARSAGSGSTRPSRVTSSQPRMLVSGLRSSWATSLTRALRWASRRSRRSARSLNASARMPVSSRVVTGTRACSSGGCWAASVSARRGRTRRVATTAVTATVTASTSPAAPTTFALLPEDMSQRGPAALFPPPRKSSATGATYGSSWARRASSRQRCAARVVAPSPLMRKPGDGVGERRSAPPRPHDAAECHGGAGVQPRLGQAAAGEFLERGQRLLLRRHRGVEQPVGARFGDVAVLDGVVGGVQDRAATGCAGDGRADAVAQEAALPLAGQCVEPVAFAVREPVGTDDARVRAAELGAGFAGGVGAQGVDGGGGARRQGGAAGRGVGDEGAVGAGQGDPCGRSARTGRGRWRVRRSSRGGWPRSR